MKDIGWTDFIKTKESLDNLFRIIDLSLLRELYETGSISFPEYVKGTTKIIKPKITLFRWVGKGVDSE
ncbi:MAG: hypothetical protein J7L96_10260 [Bacteroidales bacterium]|nr:hypothetical protein [Bacteroidales bacterium]